MMSRTHIAYAKEIKTHIWLKYKINLRHYSFIYGSIKPDSTMLYTGKTRHYFDESLDDICLSAKLLINAIDSREEMETRAFARELGVIMHYITDFFCKVHNDVGGKKHPENFTHILYEQYFGKQLEGYELDLLREKTLQTLDEEINLIYKTSLRDYLIKKHNEYMKEAGKFRFRRSAEYARLIDLKYSFCVSLMVASYIADRCVGDGGKC